MTRRAPRPFLRHAAAAAFVATLAVGCAGGGDMIGDAALIDVEVVRSLSTDDARAAAASVNTFGFALHRALVADPATAGGNVVTSPLSTATLLAMVAAGTAGQTADELVAALGLIGPQDQRFAALLREVSDTEDVSLSVANAVWLDDDHVLEAPYADFVARVFGAKAASVDLADPASAGLIDAWVSERTNGRIEGVAEDLGIPSVDAVAVLANAVHFLGVWQTEFDPELTEPSGFRLDDGNTVPVPTMSAPDNIPGAEMATRPGYEVLRLPYGDSDRFGMDVFLPDRDSDLAALLEVLDAEEHAAAMAALTPADGWSIHLPTFELEWKRDIRSAMRTLGIIDVLDLKRADLSPMTPSDVYLSSVMHKTYVRVDERGTEAAAVTAGTIGLTSMGPEFSVDRPFAFTISDRETGAVLFLGTVTDPRG